MKRIIIFRLLASLMLLWAVADHPYSYYQILRWVVCGVAAYSASIEHEKKSQVWVWIFAIVAIAFNPIAPIHFERETWQILDVATAVAFLASLWPREKITKGIA